MEFTYRFDELPLIEERGILAALIDGEATIRFDEEGEWHIREITLPSYHCASDKRTMRELEPGWLHTTICTRLYEAPYRDKIEDRVAQEIMEAA